MSFIAYIHDHPEVSVFCGWYQLGKFEKWKVNPKTELILATDNGTPGYMENYYEMTKELNFQKGEKRYINPNTNNSCGFFALTLDNIPRDRFIFTDEIKTISNGYPLDQSVRKFPSQCGLNILQKPRELTKTIFSNFKVVYPSIGWLYIVSNDDEEAIKNITKLGFIPAFYLSKKTIYFYWSK